jgi:enamine deaminase RidA (YjgF/YER057c/UK114 family)
MRRTMMIALSACALTAPALAQTPGAPPAGPVERLPSSGGEVIIPSPRWRSIYDSIQFAPARRVGDVLYVSGAIVGRGRDEGTDSAAFEAQVRRTFQQLDRTLKAAGATFDDVAMINSFHVWDGPNFTGSRDEQIAVINKVKAEFITGPHPAWTAVGTTGLLGEAGIVEIQLIAHAPRRD